MEVHNKFSVIIERRLIDIWGDLTPKHVDCY